MKKETIRYSFDLDLTNPEELKAHEQFQLEAKQINSALTKLGKRVKTKLIKSSEIVKLRAINGTIPKSVKDDLKYKNLDDEKLNELRFQGYCLKNPDQDITLMTFFARIVPKMKNSEKELKELEKFALEHFED